MAVNLFDPNFYRAANPDLAGLNDDRLLSHFLAFGANEGRTFSPYVDLGYYREHNQDLVSGGFTTNVELFNHLQFSGVAEGRPFSPVIDINYYRANNPDLAVSGLNNEQLFEHFRNFGLQEGRPSSPFFNIAFYQANNPDLQAAGLSNEQTLLHFVTSGLNEGRRGMSLAVGRGVGFADTVISFFDSGAGPIPGPYGAIDPNGNGRTDPGESGVAPISVDVVTGGEIGSSVSALSLPTGSSVTVAFTDEIIFNGVGNDIGILQALGAGETADVFVSSDYENFVFLGVTPSGQTDSSFDLSTFDLSDIQFSGQVRAVKIVSLSNGGTWPGFDVAGVQALPGSFVFG